MSGAAYFAVVLATFGFLACGMAIWAYRTREYNLTVWYVGHALLFMTVVIHIWTVKFQANSPVWIYIAFYVTAAILYVGSLIYRASASARRSDWFKRLKSWLIVERSLVVSGSGLPSSVRRSRRR